MGSTSNQAQVVAQQNDHFGLTDRSRGVGFIEKIYYRRRLTFVQRLIESAYTKNVKPTDPLGTFITGSVPCRPGVAKPHVTANTAEEQLNWLPFNTTFLNRQRFKRMQSLCNNQNSAKTLPQFSVVVGSALYCDTEYWGYYTAYSFVFVAGRYSILPYQLLGYHVYFDKQGQLYMLEIHNEINPRTQQTNIIQMVPTPICSIYPVIRYEWDANVHATVEWKLAFGMRFRRYSNYWEGDRYYHRYNERCLQAGGVFELTAEQLAQIKNEFSATNTEKMVALYVCAGTKLTVTDNYNPSDEIKLNKVGRSSGHNRSLIEQGGIVVCALENLEVSVPMDTKQPNSSEMGCDVYDWNTYCNTFLTGKPDLVQKAENMSKPVIFLGAVDSKFDSLAWGLLLEDTVIRAKVKKTWTNTRVILHVPHGARFTAVEEDSDGIAEIEARIHYEMLHDSVVTKHGTDFQVPQKDGKPDIDMLKRILNFNNDRQLFGYHHYYQGSNLMDVPYVFNFSSVAYLDNSTLPRNYLQFNFEKFVSQQQSRLAPPPMYPPVFIRDKTQGGNAVDQISYIPSQEFKISSVEKSYSTRGDNIKIRINNTEYKYGFGSCYEYHYQRVEDVQAQKCYENKTGLFHISQSNDIYRIGVDGWLWKKVNNEPIYVDEMTFFYREIQAPGTPQSTQHRTQPPWLYDGDLVRPPRGSRLEIKQDEGFGPPYQPPQPPQPGGAQ